MDDEKFLLQQIKLFGASENLEKFEKAVVIIAYLIDKNPENIQVVIDAGGILVLIKALRSINLDVCSYSIDPIVSIIEKSEESIHELINAGFLECLIELFNSEVEKKRIFANLFVAKINKCNSKVLWKPEIILSLIKILDSDNIALSMDACKELTIIGHGKTGEEEYNFDGKNAVIQAGAVPIFIKDLNGENLELCELSAKAIASLSTGNAAQIQSIINANGIPILIKLLLTSNLEICFLAMLTIIHIIRATPTQRKAIIEAGAIRAITHLMVTVADEDIKQQTTSLILFSFTFEKNVLGQGTPKTYVFES